MHLSILTLCACLSIVLSAEWNHNHNLTSHHGPNSWGKSYPNCLGDNQSPIDIDRSKVDYDPDLMPDLKFTRYDIPYDWELTNNGHGFAVNPTKQMEPEMEIHGWGQYRFAQFHFHWGGRNFRDVGSEHTIDGESFPMEIHLVHYNTKYDGVGDALAYTDGLAVIGFFFELQDSDNQNYDDLVKKLRDVRSYGEKTSLERSTLGSFLPRGFEQSKWYRYSGSLTTPPCSEVVAWTVMVDVIGISKCQLDQFKVLDAHHNIVVNNFRPVQPLNSRTVAANFKP